MQKVRSMTCLDADLTTNARTHLDTEKRTRKGAPHQDPLAQSQTEKSPKSCFVSYFPPPSSTKVNISQPGQAPSFREIFPSDSMNSSVVARVERKRDLTSNLKVPHTSSRSFPTAC